MAKKKKKEIDSIHSGKYSREEIFDIYQDVRPNKLIGKDYGCSDTHIANIKAGRVYKLYFKEYWGRHKPEIIVINKTNTIRVKTITNKDLEDSIIVEHNLDAVYYYRYNPLRGKHNWIIVSFGNIAIFACINTKELEIRESVFLDTSEYISITMEKAMRLLYKHNLMGRFKKLL